MLIVKIIKSNTVYSVQEGLHWFSYSTKVIPEISTSSTFSLYSSTNLSTDFFLHLHSYTTLKYDMIYHIHTHNYSDSK